MDLYAFFSSSTSLRHDLEGRTFRTHYIAASNTSLEYTSVQPKGPGLKTITADFTSFLLVLQTVVLEIRKAHGPLLYKYEFLHRNFEELWQVIFETRKWKILLKPMGIPPLTSTEPGFSTGVLTFFNKPLRKHLVNIEIINYSVSNNMFFPWKHL